jgi:nitrilase
VNEPVTVACVQAEPVVLDRAATIEKLAGLTAEAAGAGAELVVFPETFVPAYPSSRWAKAFAGWADPKAKAAFALLAREAVAVPGPDADRLGEIAKEHGVWLVTGVNEVDPERPGTIYNSLLYHGPDGSLALHHRKLVPTNHERLIWGPGDGRGLRAIETSVGRVGGLICWENYMPLARFSLYDSGVEIYIASTADDGEAWQATLVHIARESRAFVVSPAHFQRAGSYPEDFPLRAELEGVDILGRGGSAILAPDGSYLAGPLYDEEGLLYAELEPQRLYEERQRFDAAGHYNRPDVFRLESPAPTTRRERCFLERGHEEHQDAVGVAGGGGPDAFSLWCSGWFEPSR